MSALAHANPRTAPRKPLITGHWLDPQNSPEKGIQNNLPRSQLIQMPRWDNKRTKDVNRTNLILERELYGVVVVINWLRKRP